ncbi:hypothetical protein ACHAWF_006817, partial [Thalassiosira exigua]
VRPGRAGAREDLALRGAGRFVLTREDDGDDEKASAEEDGYFDGALDDLGAAYRRAALAEAGWADADGEGGGEDGEDGEVEEEEKEEEGNSDLEEEEEERGRSFPFDEADLLAEYVRRLNPGVRVDVASRSTVLRLLRGGRKDRRDDEDDEDDDERVIDDSDDASDDEGDDGVSLGSDPVVVCVDRSISRQLATNDACRSRRGGRSVPFVSVETAGVYAKVFCDFGDDFVVVDEDGEGPRSTLLDRVEAIPDDNGGRTRFEVRCLEGERHDVSLGDVVEFRGESGGGAGRGDRPAGDGPSFPRCEVTHVISPTRFVVEERAEEEEEEEGRRPRPETNALLDGTARSFSRVKLPRRTSFSSLREILRPTSEAEEEEPLAQLSRCDDDALFAPSDLDKSFDPVRRRAAMASWATSDAFVRTRRTSPDPSRKSERTDVERFRSLARKLAWEDDDDDDPAPERERRDALVDRFARTCRAKFVPLQAVAGALGAQEALKAATGLYNPVRQFLLYDCDEVLLRVGSAGVEAGERSLEDCASPGMAYVLGRRATDELARSRLFLVGAGAIGCELLKNLAAMGAGGGGSGSGKGERRGGIVLTDMDTIEKSNLSRQLLFRDHDVGEFKSVASRAAALRFAPGLDIEAHTSRVGDDDDDGPFDDDFWSSGCDVVLNALDNVEARLFVDGRCVAHGLGLVDAGTLGPKGNVQVVVPGESESYGSSADPPEPNIPVCTLKNFPYEIGHTIQWARDLFDGYYRRRPRQANDRVERIARTEDMTAFARSLIDELGEDAAMDMAEELGEDLGFYSTHWDSSDPEYLSAVRKDSLVWAVRQAHLLFDKAMEELIEKHPVDSLDDDGVPFWSGTRRVPKPLRFVPMDSQDDEVSAQQVIVNERIAQFVRSAARLRVESFLDVNEAEDESTTISLDEALVALDEQAKLLRKKKKSKEILHNLSGGGSSDDNDASLALVLENLNGAKTGASFLPCLKLADFEKDDESNGHVAFVTAASNLRALSYGIPPADAMETRRVAGRIVPAMITTTGLVSGLSCLELVKLIKGLPLQSHRNAFVNLALPFFAFTTPVPAEEVEGFDGKTHTIWDRITIKHASGSSSGSNMTLRKFLGKVQKIAGCGGDVEISSLSYGPYMIYANFLHSHDEELLETNLLDVVRDAVISDEDDDDLAALSNGDDEEKESSRILTEEQNKILSKLEKKRFIDFSVAVEDEETGEEFELPPVRLVKEMDRLGTEANT